MPVHPRSRGKYLLRMQAPKRGAGSSPLAREIRPGGPVELARRRFIPARAGNTPRRPRRKGRWTVHPRSRGKYGCRAGAPRSDGGSSPLAREIRRSARASLHLQPVHPRSRGKYKNNKSTPHHYNGSSPLAREIRAIATWLATAGRFIPARAGNTHGAGRDRGADAVHPRSRGKYGPGQRHGGPLAGSSPLAREIHLLMRSSSCCIAVHPRSRGKYVVAISALAAQRGSSPLAREIQEAARGPERDPRFIPARAGNTPRPAWRRPPPPVHPRSRGKYVGRVCAIEDDGGSSPLAREIR